jgi:hypothetical protein
MAKTTTQSTVTVRNAKTGKFVTVRGAGSLKGSELKIKKGVDLTKPIASQTLKRNADRSLPGVLLDTPLNDGCRSFWSSVQAFENALMKRRCIPSTRDDNKASKSPSNKWIVLVAHLRNLPYGRRMVAI